MKKLVALLLCILMMTIAFAEIEWPDSLSNGQAQLKDYIGRVNDTLATLDGGSIDVLYSLYPALASFGMNGLELPDDPFADFDPPCEISFRFTSESLHSLTLRFRDADQFEVVATACLHAAAPSAVTIDSARELAATYAAVLRSDAQAELTSPETAMTHAFQEEVNDTQGNQPRAYFSYYPNQYTEGESWLEMTLIFPLPGSADAGIVVPGSTPAPDGSEDGVWLSQDNYSHLEVFPSATPEPDSAAME